ncbi:MAG: FkbM family methyltransferase [Firmicutes bacterium]|nr:FkbM family methyltransferase [Bacillota bacterium]
MIKNGNQKYILPNGLEIYHLNKIETDFLYKEIFIEECYLKNGIELKEGSVVFDVGANIGMFSLFVSNKCKNSTIFAFEPISPIYNILKLNVEKMNSDVKIFNIGLSDNKKTQKFTFYPGMSVFSGQFAQKSFDDELLRNILLEQYNNISDKKLLNRFINHFMEERFSEQIYECELETLSNIIRENQLSRIDLLKIDVEKSELQVLLGIKQDDWKIIKQIIIEVHTDEILSELKRIIISNGFDIIIEQEKCFSLHDIYNIYAKKLLD